MPKLVRMTEAKEENRLGQQRVRLVRTEEVQSGYQTAPAAAPPASLATERADERVWDRQISTAIGTLEKPKISTLPLTKEPPALTLLSATVAANQQEGRYRPTAVSTPKQRNKQSSLATERADEADKMMVPSESRQRQQALATERADEADKMLVPSASRQAAQSTTTSSTKSQEGRSRPVEIDMPKQVVTREEWAAQQWNALTQKINDTQTKLDAANARYASVARYGTVEDRIALRTEIKDLEQQIKDLEKERGDPNLLERIEKTLSGSAKLYGAQFLGVDEWLSNVEQSYQEWKEDAGIPSGGYKDGPGGRVWGEEPTAESAKKQAEYVQSLGSNLKESGAADVERAKEGLDGLGSTIVDVGVAGTQMLADVGLGIATGGGSMLPMMLRSFGGGVQEAQEKGYSVTQQTGLGLASAATEYFTERLFDGNPAYDKDGLINKLVELVAGDGKLVSVLSSVPAEIISEGLEEVIADILEPISEKVLTGNWTGYDIEQIIHNGIVGMALGGLGQSGQYIAGKARGSSEAQKNGADGTAGILGGLISKISDYVDNAIARSRFVPNPIISDEYVEDLSIGEISVDEVNRLMQEYGINLTGYEHVLTDNDIRHIYNRHGPHTKEKLPITAEDIKKIPTIIRDADDVYYLPRSDGKKGLMYRYETENTTYYLEEIVDEEKKLRNKQMIKVPTGEVPDVKGLRDAINKKSTNPTPDDAAKAVPQMYAQDAKIDADNNIILPQSKVNAKITVKTGKVDASSYADTLREMQQPGARQPKSYADELAHVNELLQNAALSPHDQAYIQEDIADAQRSCDAAMKMIADPSATSEERTQAVQRAIDALNYARQRIDDLGLPATQHEVSEAQDALADITEKLKSYLSQAEHGYESEIGTQDGLASSYEDMYNAGGASSFVDESASAWQSGSSSTQMPNYSDAVTPREKFVNYSLDYENKKAAGKAEAYERALGYTKENADDLIDQIHKAVTSGKTLPYATEATKYGTKYKFRFPITGPNGKTKNVIAVYQIDVGAAKPRLVTNYVEAK